MRKLLMLLGVLGCVWSCPAAGAKTKVQLLLAQSEARPGDTVLAGIQLKMPPRTHTYWRNPGESGMSTTVEWTLPEGISAGALQWPVPEKFESVGIVTYGYHDEVMLLVPLTIAPDAPSGVQQLSAKVSWLECEELCIPGSATVKASLFVGAESKASPVAAEIEAVQKKLPQPGGALDAAAVWEQTAGAGERSFVVTWKASAMPASADFYPYASEDYDVLPATALLPFEAGKARLRKSVTKLAADWPSTISGVLVQKLSANGEEQAYEIKFDFSKADATHRAAMPLGLLVKMLGAGFLGGLILNIMPCVFPVIALKILGFVQQSKESPAKVFQLGLIYALGVIASFLVMAGIVIGVQQAGGSASWGMQMKNPQFTLMLTLLVLLVSLNLFGVFEINLGGRTMGAAGELASQQGAAGAFFNGVLATALATPCTAPFLAPALGFAFAQPPTIIIGMFLAVALGLASPYVVLSWRPEWLRFLPRPGSWMERFKVVMGFPMLATAVWLFSFTAKRFGPSGPLWVGLFLVTVALAAWIWGEFVQRGGQRKGLAMALCILLLGGGYGYALERELHWRNPSAVSDSIAWQTWSPEAVAKARTEGRPVLVDFTADWCLTCKYNLRAAIDVSEVRTKLKELNAVALIGDNTDEDPAIVAELKKFDRAGVPLVLVYPRDGQSPPEVLPALLTKGLVLDALDRAAR